MNEQTQMEDIDNQIWALREASKPSGFVPHEKSVAEFVKSLEYKGWLYTSERGPAWEITPKGRAALARFALIMTNEEQLAKAFPKHIARIRELASKDFLAGASSGYSAHSTLSYAFDWYDSKEGGEFWNDIYQFGQS